MRWRFEKPSAAVMERANNELSVISQTGYASYFLIVWDFYKFARQQGIVVGPGRGSAAGSLVSYCLGITNLDPLAHGLIFERFLNIDRVSMPDIDCDFSVEGREKVINYVSKKYGVDRVAQIITFTTMASKAAIRDVGRVLEVPLRDTDRLAKLIPVWQGRSKSLADAMKEVPEFRQAYEASEEQKRLIDVAQALEGVSRNVSTHAAGVVIAPEPAGPVHAAAVRAGARGGGDAVRHEGGRRHRPAEDRLPRPAEPRHHRHVPAPAARASRPRDRHRADPLRRRQDLRAAVGGGHAWCVPAGRCGHAPDGHGHAAAGLLGRRGGGRAVPPGPDGQHPRLHRAQAGPRAHRVHARAAGADPARDVRRDDLPGAGDDGRARDRRLHDERGGHPARRDGQEGQAQDGQDAHQVHRRVRWSATSRRRRRMRCSTASPSSRSTASTARTPRRTG